ncbi:DUF1254 domain-containing protein [Sorangium sp. So ce1097]|uniref:DUF1254 domain-containing protein n=1 Tax=Sorangium sp. So ce1097 TaxID=3133330 RepID=UPI003F62FAFC
MNKQIDQQTVYDIGVDAYTYLYPLVLMDVTRLQSTNVVTAGDVYLRAPANTFANAARFPSADFKDVVRPNFDTLYSNAWLDLTKEPMVVSAPVADGRYYLLPMLDMWTEVFHSPGVRTTGSGAVNFALVPPGWEGTVPEGVTRVDAPTPYIWVLGRTQCSGPGDYDDVHRFQAGLKITPLSRFPAEPLPVIGIKDPAIDNTTPPLDQVKALSPAQFYAYGAELMKLNPPHFCDYPILAQMAKIGLVPGKPFDLNSAPPAVRQALERAAGDAYMRIEEHQSSLGTIINGWSISTDMMGSYGSSYLGRATVALIGLGANLVQDAIYPLNLGDASGQPLDGANRYTLRFAAGETPPVNAFWSVTMYDMQGFAVANPLKRYSLGSMHDMVTAPDGSLTMYFQHQSPGTDKEPNWLPAPSGPFNLTMRLYYPKNLVLDGEWTPPKVERAPASRQSR